MILVASEAYDSVCSYISVQGQHFPEALSAAVNYGMLGLTQTFGPVSADDSWRLCPEQALQGQ